MCTSAALINGCLYFGRNMDIDRDYGHQVVIMPRSFPFPTKAEGTLEHHYAMVGMASMVNGIPLYADAMNEFGLCGAGLNFPGNACYSNNLCTTRHNITPYELIPWILGRCTNISEARELLKNTSIYGQPFSESLPLASLHWHFADKTGSIVLEAMADGIHIYDNSANVLTNNPPLDFHITNLSHYLNLTSAEPSNILTTIAGEHPFSNGLGSYGLPGDYSSASRFIKSVFLLKSSPDFDSPAENIAQLRAILDAAAVVKGSVVTKESMDYCTVYSCLSDAERKIYYYKLYTNSQLKGIKLMNEDIDGKELIRYFFEKNQQICWEN